MAALRRRRAPLSFIPSPPSLCTPVRPFPAPERGAWEAAPWFITARLHGSRSDDAVFFPRVVAATRSVIAPGKATAEGGKPYRLAYGTQGRVQGAGVGAGAEEAEDPDDGETPSGPKKTVKIFCAKCGEIIYKYRKGGNGALVKCFVERIAEDYTEGDMKCGACRSEFARLRMIKGKPAHKIIGGKVFMRK